MTLYDMRVPIHETADGLPSIHDLIETLDEMLTHHNIRHCFTLATYDEQLSVKTESDKDLSYWLFYEQEQNTELTLIVALFIKMYLKKDDSDILASIVKSMSRAS